MAGGAVRGPREIKTLGSQIDWVPTLLHQMDMEAEQFAFAKDLLDTVRAPYAYYHFVDGFAYITDSDTTIIDRCAEGVQNTDRCADRHKAEAVTQRIYESLD
jgi:arylsulfatase A-like enzyme